ncbi:MAG: response regulator transcription factor [Spirochaetaceae bacterium]|nr:response regulator transcription factor [Spirochaetaceae bacterium]
MANIYVVEDNESIREAVTGYLQLADHEVSGFGELAGVKEALEEHTPDLILLDVMLPDGDGFIFAKELLSRESIPLIFMSARESESDRITGFEIGADDYIVKPFSPKELVLRVAAVLKRSSSPVSRAVNSTWSLEGHSLATDEDSHKAALDGEPLKLTAAEWKILLYLSSNGGAVVTREQILDRCLEYSFEGYDRTVDTHIKNLRAKLGQPGWIETVRGYGYRFAGEAT